MTGFARRTTWERYEAKYLISERLAERIARFCRRNLQLDPHCVPFADRQYPIHSVYLDSADHRLARDVVDAQPDRFKLRVRTYRQRNQPPGELPAFFEVKRKCMGLVYKNRAVVKRAQVDDLLWRSYTPSLPSLDPAESGPGLAKFVWLRHKIAARPAISVFYTREAYESPVGQNVRLSFDRNLYYGLLDAANGQSREVWWPTTLRGVIFEVKFTNTYPAWLSDLLASSELVREGVCKYLICTQAAKGLFQQIEERRVV